MANSGSSRSLSNSTSYGALRESRLEVVIFVGDGDDVGDGVVVKGLSTVVDVVSFEAIHGTLYHSVSLVSSLTSPLFSGYLGLNELQVTIEINKT